MKNLQQNEYTLDSREVANMVEKTHGNLVRDLHRYISQLNEGNIPFVEFFRESTYKDSKGETRPCYQITKKGCEFIAHKLTGTKGTIFTARYINRFHQMQAMLEKRQQVPELPWFIKEYRGRRAITQKDFTKITGVDIEKHKLFYRPEYFKGGYDYNRTGWDEERKMLYDGNDNDPNHVSMIFMFESGVRKAIKILKNDKDVKMIPGVEDILLKGFKTGWDGLLEPEKKKVNLIEAKTRDIKQIVITVNLSEGIINTR